MRKYARSFGSIAVALLVMLAPFISINVSASHTTWYPPPKSMSCWHDGTWYDTWIGVQFVSDGIFAWMWSTTHTQFIDSGFFNGPGDYEAPPANATIREVHVHANLAAWTLRWFYLAYSVDGDDDNYYNYRAIDHFGVITSPPNQQMSFLNVDWNVTAMESWTPALLLGSSFWVRILSTNLTSEPDALLVNYIGVHYIWTLPGEEWPGEEEQSPPFLSLNSGTINGILSGIGFVGMIGFPAYCIYMGRQTDERLRFFVIAIAGMAVFFALFLAGIS